MFYLNFDLFPLFLRYLGKAQVEMKSSSLKTKMYVHVLCQQKTRMLSLSSVDIGRQTSLPKEPETWRFFKLEVPKLGDFRNNF